ncbi:diaminopimelate decarboxylase [Candidatus Termititenax dinenymphae]|uniref:Diaminopimelate decarboxylase n=1 Tax=Candidatus Termititenax dinenymphae TaxID=2218523 RepID=A0A388TLP2_9BACT|nr:diaminopimelate decarboxylase [Candidatus Termititenax dinenymphae]
MLYNKNQYMPVSSGISVNNNLEIGGCDLAGLAAEYGTPLYIMDEETLRANCRDYMLSFSSNYSDVMIAYASKALSVLGVLKIIGEEGLGVDVVSGGELYLALKAGIVPQKIIFHGNNKSPQELIEALQAGVGLIVVDNLQELKNLEEIAGRLQKKASILIRVTPGIEAHTHDFIKTGGFDSKFGIHIERVCDFIEEIKHCNNIDFAGLHAHIGSQILEVNPFGFAVEKMTELIEKIQKRNHLEIKILNLGGGLGISYLERETPPPVAEYARVIGQELKYNLERRKLPFPKLIIEPGRSIVGRAGVTLYTIGAVKENKNIRKYLFVDGGMSDNPRPMMYGAKYAADIVSKISSRKNEMVTVAGKFCESGDVLIKDIHLPAALSGDLLAVYATGAYNYAMASNYNQNPRPAMVLVGQGKSRLLVRRETYDDLTAKQE